VTAGGLTLDEVRRAGRLAWHPVHHYLFSDGRLLRVVVSAQPGDSRKPVTMNLRVSALSGSEQHIQDGWLHLEDCDCGLCAVGGSAGAGTRRASATRQRPGEQGREAGPPAP
jgi:hypothetical protein